MAEPINLNKARKARQRAADKAQAAVNRAKFGRPKAQREADAAREALESRRLDGAQRGAHDEPEDGNP